MLELPEIAVDLVHPAVLSALGDVEALLDELLVAAATLTRPDLLESLRVDVPVQKPLVEQVGAAAVDVAVGHDVRPEVWSRQALGVVAVFVGQFLHRVTTENDLKAVAI